MRDEWIELRKAGRLWAKFNPRTNEILFVRGKRRARFRLSEIRARQDRRAADQESDADQALVHLFCTMASSVLFMLRP